jgi:sensor histidine kinase regulating citrate/malate metabolism
VVAVVILPVMVVVWILRKLRVRRQTRAQAERALAEAEAIRLEQEIIDDMERRIR